MSPPVDYQHHPEQGSCNLLGGKMIPKGSGFTLVPSQCSHKIEAGGELCKCMESCKLVGPRLKNGEGNGTPLQYSCLENPMDGGAWEAVVHGVAEGRTRLSDFTFTFMHGRRKWHPTPVFLPGESQRQGSLVGCHLWGRTESDTTEAT